MFLVCFSKFVKVKLIDFYDKIQTANRQITKKDLSSRCSLGRKMFQELLELVLFTSITRDLFELMLFRY